MKYLASVLLALCLGCGGVSHPPGKNGTQLSTSSAEVQDYRRAVPKEGFAIEASRGQWWSGSASLAPGETLKLSAIRYEMWPGPRRALDKGVSWISTDPSIATVDDHGVVTAVHLGTTTIFAKCETCPKESILTAYVTPELLTQELLTHGRMQDSVAKSLRTWAAGGAPFAEFPILIRPMPHVLPHFPDQVIYFGPPARPPKFFTWNGEADKVKAETGRDF